MNDKLWNFGGDGLSAFGEDSQRINIMLETEAWKKREAWKE
jgi:hypothetical protein